jgi:hypothetical protein
MNCWNCNTEMIWNSDIDFDDRGLDGDGYIALHSCPACLTWTETYVPSTVSDER